MDNITKVGDLVNMKGSKVKVLILPSDPFG
jgi:hypothetical protein